MMQPFRRAAMLVAVFALLLAGQTAADITRAAAERLCVDVVVVERDRDIRGVIISRSEDGGATLAVRRGWLITEQPEVYEEFRSAEIERLTDGEHQLIERIDSWIAELDAETDRALIAVLEDEREAAEDRIENPDDAVDESEFVLLEYGVDRVQAIYPQTPRRKQAGLCGYHFELENVESTILPDLESELGQLDPNWQALTVDLSHRLAARGMQSDREWAARRGLFDYHFRKHMAFQGTGDAIVRVDIAGQGDVGDALTQILGGGLNVDIEDHFDTPQIGQRAESTAWKDRATAIADEEGALGCRVTRVAPDLVGRTATVEEVFLARMPDGTWETIWSTSVTSRPGEVPEEAVDRIREDPNVQSIISTAELLGIGTVEMNQALSFGAATMHAQSQANGQFQEFLSRHLRGLNGPPLERQ